MTNESIGTSASYPRRFLELRARIRALGIDDWGCAPIADASSYALFLARAREGYCGGLTYLTENPEARRSPRSVLPEARTILVAALSESRVRAESADAAAAIYDAPELRVDRKEESGAVGVVSGYATCLDYHDLLRKRLKGLGQYLKELYPDAPTRVAVDTAPILEKNWAIECGLGFCGLNSLTIHPEYGSRFFLGELLTATSLEELTGFATRAEYDAARVQIARESGERVWTREEAREKRAQCERCRRCVDACPTNALTPEGALDARRCLNYWTIENRDEIPDDIARALDGRLFGCDLCQRVCPRNARVEATAPRELPLDAVERLDDATFRRLFKKTPVFRARVDGLQRVARALRERGEDGEGEN